MLEFIKNLFSSENFLPHVHCYLGNAAVIRLHFISDLLIALAYYSIPVILLYFIRKRQDIPFRGIFFMFGAFILACGTTHLMEMWTLWYPTYWLSGLIKACTALLSIATALILIPTTPKALTLRSPQELEKINQELEKQILQKKIIEEKLTQSQIELEKRVEERTQELTKEIIERKRFENALENKTKELARSNKELEHFAYITSHDLQEPLYVISGFSDTLKEQFGKKINKEGLFLVERIQSAAHRMDQLIKDLLEFARVSTQKKPFEKIDLNLILQEIISILEIKIKETRTQIKIERLPTIYADKNQILQLFQNLIGNSIKFRKTNVDPEILIKPLQINEDFVEILVKDNGIGFEQTYSDKILEPFQRLHTREEYEGSGLGLAICQKIALRHGGKISGNSTPQQGASFVITFSTTKEFAHE